MPHNLVICGFSEQRYMISNLCTFFGHPVYINTLENLDEHMIRLQDSKIGEARNDNKYFQLRSTDIF